MEIRQISRLEFQQLHPKRYPGDVIVGEEVEWWGNPTGSVIGAIAMRFLEPRWRYIVLHRMASGEFRIQQLESGIESQPLASHQLVQAMELTENGGNS